MISKLIRSYIQINSLVKYQRYEMNERILKLMSVAGYAAPELATRAIKLAELIIEENIQTLINNGYDDAAKCLRDVQSGVED